MTTQELQNILEENSPFMVKGYNETYSFRKDSFFAGDELLAKFRIIPDGKRFKIMTDDIVFQFWKNIKIVIEGADGFPVIVNYDPANSTPRKGEENGYLILKSTRK